MSPYLKCVVTMHRNYLFHACQLLQVHESFVLSIVLTVCVLVRILYIRWLLCCQGSVTYIAALNKADAIS